MKKIIIIFVITFITVSFASAQSQLYFGLGGTGISTWTTNQNNYGQFEMDYSTRFGYIGNINIGFDFNDNLGVKTEIGISSLGQNYKDTRNDTVYRRDISLTYLQIPLLFKLRAGGEKAKFFMAIGPQLNVLMSAKQIYKKNEDMWNETAVNIKNETFIIGKEDIKDRYNSTDIMARLDLGVEINFTENLFLDAGLTLAYGLTDINAENYRINDSDGNYNASHNIYGGFQVGINYSLPIGK